MEEVEENSHPRHDATRYSLTIDEVVLMFEEAGLARTKRSIQRACKRGIFESILADTDTGQRYYITEESVLRRIEELKQIEHRDGKVTTRPDPTGHDATSRDTPRPDATRREPSRSAASSGESDAFEKEMEDLKLEVINLKVDNRAKEMFISQMVRDRKELLSQVRDGWEKAVQLSANVGQLQAQLQITAPSTRENKERFQLPTVVEPEAPANHGEANDTSDNEPRRINYQPLYPHHHESKEPPEELQ